LEGDIGVPRHAEVEHGAADGCRRGVRAGDELERYFHLALALCDAVAEEGAEHVLLVFSFGAEAFGDHVCCDTGRRIQR
jgi:hypothetical protein